MDQYEVEYFGFTSKQLSLERRHVIKNFLDNALNNIISKLTKNEETRELMMKEKSNVITNIMTSFEQHLRSLDDLDKKTFSVPPSVISKINAEIDSFSEKDENDLDEKLKKLKQECLENSVFKAALEMENSQLESLQPLVAEEEKVQQQLKQAFQTLDTKEIDKLVKQITSFK